MERNEIQDLISSDEKSLTQNLYNFIEKYNKVQTFPELENNDLRPKLWSALFTFLTNKNLKSAFVPCLSVIRILSRDKTSLNDLMREEWIKTLLKLSCLQKPEKILENKNIPPDYDIIIEALKVLCNLVFNSSKVQRICSENGTIEGIIKRLLTYSDLQIPNDVKYFDMRLLFITTALCVEVRPKLKEELHGVIYLMEVLDVILKESSEECTSVNAANKLILMDDQVNLACEILKVLYNLTVKTNFDVSIDEEEEAHYIRLVIILHDLLLRQTESTSKSMELQSHIINLLTTLPLNSLKELVTPIPDKQEIPKEFEYDGYNMEVIHVLLTFLKNKLNSDPVPKGQNDLLSPVLLVLLNCAKSSRIMRKYLRYQILPPLRDVMQRPEQGNTLRNHLCRMLTTPVVEVSNLAAELLFVLCKENMGRMIKYTGYGNAAGLFANRGILAGPRPDTDSSKYSSESDDSDTEEYKQYKHGINAVLGCYEPPHVNPLENMTEEQKEYEAMKLVNLVHNLNTYGVIQPCRINEEGKPEPITHVLQLQEELSKQKIRRDDDDSD